VASSRCSTSCTSRLSAPSPATRRDAQHEGSNKGPRAHLRVKEVSSVCPWRRRFLTRQTATAHQRKVRSGRKMALPRTFPMETSGWTVSKNTGNTNQFAQCFWWFSQPTTGEVKPQATPCMWKVFVSIRPCGTSATRPRQHKMLTSTIQVCFTLELWILFRVLLVFVPNPVRTTPCGSQDVIRGGCRRGPIQYHMNSRVILGFPAISFQNGMGWRDVV
jgi:hypothetical protein